jgi:argininosuccinate lyase
LQKNSLNKKATSWSGRFSEPVAELVKKYTASVDFDKRLAEFDIQGSIAHAQMLGAQGIISKKDVSEIEKGLAEILAEIQAGKFEWLLDLEDVHLNIEKRLTDKIGDVCTRAAAVTTKWLRIFGFGCARRLTMCRRASISCKSQF